MGKKSIPKKTWYHNLNDWVSVEKKKKLSFSAKNLCLRQYVNYFALYLINSITTTSKGTTFQTRLNFYLQLLTNIYGRSWARHYSTSTCSFNPNNPDVSTVIILPAGVRKAFFLRQCPLPSDTFHCKIS